MEPGPPTEGSVDKSNMEQQYMSLTPEVKADLEHLAAHSSSEEERTQAQEALRELEERAAEQASPGQLYLRARRGLPVRSSTADNIKNGNGTAFETVQKNLEDVLNATRGDRLARIDEGTVGKFPIALHDHPLLPQFRSVERFNQGCFTVRGWLSKRSAVP